MTWVEPDQWYAQLASFYAAAAVFVTDWASPANPRLRPLVNFLFDGGQLPSESNIPINPDELELAAFYHLDQAQRLLPPRVAPRIEAAMEARAKGTTAYLIDGCSPGTVGLHDAHLVIGLDTEPVAVATGNVEE